MPDIRQTKITLDLGTVFHVLFGVLAVVLGREWLFSSFFVIKQMIDLIWGGEEPAETSGDLVEYLVGFCVALLIRRLI